MSYIHSNQYRCTIVRGKSYTEMDDLLNAYANIVNDICPATPDEFSTLFNSKLVVYLGEKIKKKTLDNHRTETVGKLLGMYYKGEDNIIYCSERVIKLLEDSDQPAFFKELILKYQFPSGMSKLQTVRELVEKKIKIRQFPFLLNLLKIADKENISITKFDIGYYVLNNLDVLSSIATPNEVLVQIKKDKSKSIIRKIGEHNSFNDQHINEQLNLLVLANLVYYDEGYVRLNKHEEFIIKKIAAINYAKLEFDFEQFDLSDQEDRRFAEEAWNKYFASNSEFDPNSFITNSNALTINSIKKSPINSAKTSDNRIELGDEGEEYVYKHEISRVSTVNPRLVNRVKLFGKIRGLGYDIHSVYAEGRNADFAKYIEVKSTKRVTEPGNDFLDTVILTKNEWSAAAQHGENYFIYRLYFSNQGVKMFVIKNPFLKSETGLVNIEAISYRAEFTPKAGEFLENKYE